MRFKVIDDGTGSPLMKTGEQDDTGQPVKWADIGEVVDIPTDSQSAAERQRAQSWLRGQGRKLQPVPSEPRMASPVTRDMKPESTTTKAAPKKAKKGD